MAALYVFAMIRLSTRSLKCSSICCLLTWLLIYDSRPYCWALKREVMALWLLTRPSCLANILVSSLDAGEAVVSSVFKWMIGAFVALTGEKFGCCTGFFTLVALCFEASDLAGDYCLVTILLGYSTKFAEVPGSRSFLLISIMVDPRSCVDSTFVWSFWVLPCS